MFVVCCTFLLFRLEFFFNTMKSFLFIGLFLSGKVCVYFQAGVDLQKLASRSADSGHPEGIIFFKLRQLYKYNFYTWTLM